MPAISWLYIIKKQESHLFLISRQFHIMLPFVHGYNCHESCFFFARKGLVFVAALRFDGYISQAFAYLDEPWTRRERGDFIVW